MTYYVNDTLTRTGATDLASRIVRYWASQGYIVKAWVEEDPGMTVEGKPVFRVVSDMKDGVPTKRVRSVRGMA